MAEGEGFEPPVRFPVRLISSQVPLTTQPPFQRELLQCRHSIELTTPALFYGTVSSTHCVSTFFAVLSVQSGGLFASKRCEAVFSPPESFQPNATFTGSSLAVR